MNHLIEEYPTYKKVLWRFSRVFIAAFLVELAIMLPKLENADVNTLYQLVLVPCLVAGLNAIGKAIREYTGGADKLPF